MIPTNDSRQESRARSPLAAVFHGLLIAGCLLLLAGCQTTVEQSAATAPPSEPQSASSESDRRIAKNLIAVIAQLEEIPPWTSTVQINKPNSSFGAALFDAFESAGYGVQLVPEDQGANFVSFRSSSGQTESGTEHRYTLWIGGRISLERRFRELGGQLLPVSPIVVTGTAASNLLINDDDYASSFVAGERFPSGVEFRDESFELVQSFTRTLVTDGSGVSAEAQRSAREAQNVSDRFLAYRPKSQTTLSFPSRANNVLGDLNKKAIVAISESFDRASDLFLVSGCRPPSVTGPADPRDEAMARSDRVVAELLTRGLAEELIFVENCEPGRYNSDLPPRSVILTLERLRDV